MTHTRSSPSEGSHWESGPLMSVCGVSKLGHSDSSIPCITRSTGGSSGISRRLASCCSLGPSVGAQPRKQFRTPLFLWPSMTTMNETTMKAPLLPLRMTRTHVEDSPRIRNLLKQLSRLLLVRFEFRTCYGRARPGISPFSLFFCSSVTRG